MESRVDSLPNRSRGNASSYLPVLLLVLIVISGLPASPGSTSSQVTYEEKQGLPSGPANTLTTTQGHLTITYPLGHPARYYLVDDLGSIELIPSSSGVGDLYRHEGKTIEVTGNLVEQDNQRTLYVENWTALAAMALPSVSGPQSTLMILIQFSDIAGSHSVNYFQNLLTGSSGSMNAYYVEVSYNTITITGGPTSQWYTLNHASTYYDVHTWDSCISGGDFSTLAQDIVNKVDPDVNFNNYSHFLFVTADSYVWGCRLGGYNFHTNDGITLHSVAFVSEGYGLSTFAHEFGHDLGLPDLYDYTGQDLYDFVDGWDLMSIDRGQHLSAWSKIQLGWIPSSRIRTIAGTPDTQTVERTEDATSGYQAIKILTGTNIYFLLETRQKVGFDINLPSGAPDHGLLITKIDETKGNGRGIVRLVDANPNTRSGLDGDAVWQVSQTYIDSYYSFSISVQSWTGHGFTVAVRFNYSPTAQFGSTTISVLDAPVGTAYFIFPDGNHAHPKPSGVGYASVTDWTALGYVYGMMNNMPQITALDTNSTYIDQTTGAPKVSNSTIILFAGPLVNSMVHYYEANRVAPLWWSLQGGWTSGTEYYRTRSGDVAASIALSDLIGGGKDMLLVESFTDSNNNKVLIFQGFGWQGTYSSGLHMKTVLYGNLAGMTDSWYAYSWMDKNGNGFVEDYEISATPINHGN